MNPNDDRDRMKPGLMWALLMAALTGVFTTTIVIVSKFPSYFIALCWIACGLISTIVTVSGNRAHLLFRRRWWLCTLEAAAVVLDKFIVMASHAARSCRGMTRFSFFARRHGGKKVAAEAPGTLECVRQRPVTLAAPLGAYAATRCSKSADPAPAVHEVDPNKPLTCSPAEATWRVACAAPHHMTGDQSLLLTSSYMPVHHHDDDDGGEVVMVHPATIYGEAAAAVPLRARGTGSVRTESIALDDVWYVPGLDSNLVSTGQLARQGCAVVLGAGGCRITTSGGAQVGTARFTEAGQFELDFLKVAAA